MPLPSPLPLLPPPSSQHLHERGIMHRDIKVRNGGGGQRRRGSARTRRRIAPPSVMLQPANVLVDAAGHACLSDLGLSTFISNATLRAALTEKMRASAAASPGSAAPTAEARPDLRRCSVEVNGRVVKPYGRGKAGTPGYWAPGEAGGRRNG